MKANIGLIGLAVMGENLALNMESKGFTVAVYNRSVPGEEGVVDRFINGRGKSKRFIGTHSIEQLVDSVKSPHIIMMMVKAGRPVDELISQLLPFLSSGDVIIDGGNSDFHDTERRVKELEKKGIYFVGTGISGGEEGALHGPSVMPGGSVEAWPLVKDILQGISAKLDDGSPCCEWIGAGGAGHFVKMVHNGIEYGDMQLISEAYSLLKNRKGLDNDAMAVVFDEWNGGELDSFLIEITANILRFRDEDGKPLLDKILDVAGQKGTGKWSAIAAMDENDPLTLITEAVYARLLSALYPERIKAASLYSGKLKVESVNSDTEPLSTFNSQLSTINDIEQEFIFHYFATVNRMKEVMREANVEMKIDTYFRLLKRVTDTITIPFQGEPLSGLQIMGVLETRALDFDRLIILSMNEGIFPLRKAANSFIPYNLRRGFGLPTYEHQDSVWAYHFYRLIYRASHVSLLYDTRSNGLQTGEVSRFVHQLHYHYEEPIQNKLVVYNVSSSKTPALQVAKTEEVMNRLADFRSGGTRAISASAVNTYLDCPLKFYFSVVEGIREEEEVSETIESNVFGSILHKVMEELYQPFCGKMVTADLLKAIRKDTPMLTGAVARAFAEIFFKTDIVRPLTGQNFLIGEMIRKYVEKVLERDAKQTPFRYIESEKKIKCLFPLTDKSNIQLKGFIDRIDEVRDVVRIIDYKSGSGTTQFTSVEALFDKADTDRSKAVMQVFMYAWMFNRSVQLSTAIQPGIYYMRTLFSSSFDPGIYHRTDRFKTEQVLDFANYRTDFEDSLRNCLDEIFDTETPFVQTPNGKACMYCPFKDICGK